MNKLIIAVVLILSLSCTSIIMSVLSNNKINVINDWIGALSTNFFLTKEYQNHVLKYNDAFIIYNNDIDPPKKKQLQQ